MKTTSMLARIWLAVLLVSGTIPAFAQDTSFTAAYISALPFSRTANNNSHMVITPYYGSDLVKPGYLIASNVDASGLSVKLTALRTDGTLSWSKTYTSAEGDREQSRRCFALTYNSFSKGYVLTGYRYNQSTARDELWLLSVDADGNQIGEYGLSADSIPCSYVSGPAASLCTSFAAPSFYGLSIVQVKADDNRIGIGDFVITGFLSEDRATGNYRTPKRSFVWRFSLSPRYSSVPYTRFLKVFHSVDNGRVNPTREEFTTDVQEIPGYGLMLLGHITDGSSSASRESRRPYYALMNYDGGGASLASTDVFKYAFNQNSSIKNVRSLLARDGNIYLMGYYYPKHSFTITPIKPASGGNGSTYTYFATNVSDLPAFSMKESSNTNELVVMGYRLGINEPVPSDYVHPYTIKIPIGPVLGNGTLKFNLEAIKSQGYVGFTPADQSSFIGTDYFRPFENNAFPLAAVPDIGLLNNHINNLKDAVVAGVLRKGPSPSQESFHATASGFRFVTGDAECHPYQLIADNAAVPLTYQPFNFAVNAIQFKVNQHRSDARNEAGYLACEDIPTQRPALTTAAAAINISGKDIKVYPNPVSDMLYLEAGVPGRYTYRISTVAGIPVYNGGFEGKTSVSMSNMAQGLYFIHITDESGTQQIVKFLKR